MPRILRLLSLILAIGWIPAGWAFDIHKLLDNFEQSQLAECPAISEPTQAVRRLTDEFTRLISDNAILRDTQFRVSGCKILAQVRANTVVVSETLADYNENERLFVLAHELGHIANKDWARVTTVYAEATQDSKTMEDATAVLAALAPQVMSLSHAAEFSADRFAVDLLAATGHPPTNGATSILRRLPRAPATGTQPAPIERLARVSALKETRSFQEGFTKALVSLPTGLWQ